MSAKLIEEIKEIIIFFPIIFLFSTIAAFIEAYFSDKRNNRFSSGRERMGIYIKKRNIKDSEDKD